ncbi:MAG TPA: hypothetical protein VGK29_06900 [Paludibaculum sp.]
MQDEGMGSPGKSRREALLRLGAGTAGTIAAIQAGRLGARTMLVEAGASWAER